MAKKRTELTVKVGVPLEELVAALRAMSDEDREWFLETLLAATSPAYLSSIQEAREDYRQGRSSDAREVFQD